MYYCKCEYISQMSWQTFADRHTNGNKISDHKELFQDALYGEISGRL